VVAVAEAMTDVQSASVSVNAVSRRRRTWIFDRSMCPSPYRFPRPESSRKLLL